MSHINLWFFYALISTEILERKSINGLTPPMMSQHSRSQALVKEEGCDRRGEPTLNLAILMEIMEKSINGFYHITVIITIVGQFQILSVFSFKCIEMVMKENYCLISSRLDFQWNRYNMQFTDFFPNFIHYSAELNSQYNVKQI